MIEQDFIDFNRIPIKALNVSSRMMLSKLLNPEMEIPTSAYLCKDYRGLAELIGYDHMTIENFKRNNDPMKKLLEDWEMLPENSVGNLINMLKKIERYDVIEDIEALIVQNARSYIQRIELAKKPVQVPEISSDPVIESTDILTLDDMIASGGEGGSLTRYDAYVCYAEADRDFVEQLAEYLESPEIGVKLCIKDRDMVIGVNVYETTVRLIEERCNRMLIIMSPEFLQSEECKFQTRYATSLAIDHLKQKLIPLLYKPCPLPHLLKYVSKVDFTKADFHEWIWKKLVISIKGCINNNILLPSQTFCPDLHRKAQLCSAYNNTGQYPLMLPAPTQSRSRSTSPQPSITFPSSSSLSCIPSSASLVIPQVVPSRKISPPATLAIPQPVSSQTKNASSPLSRSKWLSKFRSGGFSSNSNNNNTSSGFHSYSDGQKDDDSDDFIEKMV